MLETLFQNSSQQVLTKYNPQIREINEIGKRLKKFTDLELQETATELKTKLQSGTSKELVINEAFALVREASDRILGLRHFDVQLVGGLALTEGKIAEMKTGEGKTLVALLPTFFYALYGKGTHVITVNDYLAKRDSEYVGKVHEFLGLSVGLIQEDMTQEERKENYNCDVVYVTNNELGFDYLRDNMAFQADELVQRPFFYCLIDEVDSVLIDEARTPLIISGANEAPTEKYIQTAKLARILKPDIHYKVDEKAQAVTLNSAGVSLCEQALGISDLYNPADPWMSYILNSVKGKELFQKDKNYIIDENNEVVIVDEFTGRTMQGRRWSDGLHQAVEAKEGVPIKDESQTLASITYQNLFLLYETLSGMTGTAKTEEGEFEKIYNLNVVQIPTNKPVARKDLSDLIYKNQYQKWRAIAEECVEMHNIGRPVLVGTTTIEKSELLAALLSEYGIPYQLLNAKPENVESESIIVAQAGCEKAVTIATNMAGRGTDIVLGGNPKLLKETRVAGNNESSFIKNLGGLHVIGTERHESRRIDNQLRGRSGRQGDPGSSRFFLSLEDKLLRIFGGDQILGMMQNIGFQDDTPIESSLLNKSLESAQKKVEAYYFDTRKQLFEYDQALNTQRKCVYAERKRILEQENLRDWVLDYADRSLYDLSICLGQENKNQLPDGLKTKLQSLLGLPFSLNSDQDSLDKSNFPISLDFLQQQVQITYDLKELEMESIEKGLLRELEKSFILQHIDYSWKEHLQKIAFLRDSIRWRAYGQKNPLTEYQKEAFNYYTMMLAEIRHRVVYFVFSSKIILQ
tara:strand:- start:2066 stop:4474 length:2409 start_codon:yes stop_codon:yes gene_type:complete